VSDEVVQLSIVYGYYPISTKWVNSWTTYARSTLSYTVSKADLQAIMDQIQGDIPPVVNVPNMLLELPQTLNLWHDLRKPIEALFRDRTARKKWRAGSNALLSQQFGFIPLVSDITALWRSSRNVHSELLRIQKEQSRPTRMRKGIRAEVNASLALVQSPANLSLENVRSHGELYVTYHARPSRYLDVTDPAVISAVSRSLYGFDKPLGVLWEATPFSFVADWFYPIGDYLKTLEKSTFAGRLAISDIVTCARGQVSGDVFASFDTTTGRQKMPCGRLLSTLFDRKIGLPSVAPFSDLSLPGVKQCILGAALVLQK